MGSARSGEKEKEVWFQIYPNYTFLYAEMVTYAEEHLGDRVDNLGFVKVHVNDGCELAEIGRVRGYKQLKYCTHHSEYVIHDDLPAPQLPEGFVVKSVLEEKGYIRSEWEHPSDLASQYTAELLSQMGYEPVSPP